MLSLYLHGLDYLLAGRAGALDHLMHVSFYILELVGFISFIDIVFNGPIIRQFRDLSSRKLAKGVIDCICARSRTHSSSLKSESRLTELPSSKIACRSVSSSFWLTRYI